MMIDSDNVHLLRPLSPIADLTGGRTLESIATEFNAGTISPYTGMIAIDFYDALPGQRDALIDQFQAQIVPLYEHEGVSLRGIFVAEMRENTFPALPAIQNPDECVVITAY